MSSVASRMVAVLIFISGSHALCALVGARANAALGDKVDVSTSTSSALQNTTAGVRIRANFAVKESSSKQTSLREYVGSNGVVFGVVWSGRNHPDLAELLGTYYGEYRVVHSQERSSRRSAVAGPGGFGVGFGVKMRGSRRTLQSDHVVVERFGHMGAIRGRAFVPALLPEGVSANEIK